MKNNLLIIGANGHGKVIADIALKMNKWKNIAFLDDDEKIKSSMGLDVIGKSYEAINYKEKYEIFVAIGNNATRESIITKLKLEDASIPTLVHPNAVIGKNVNLGYGTAVMAGVVINSCTKIGKGSIINTSATIDHDNLIEDFVHISPGAHLAGNVKIGHSTWVGIGGVVCNNIDITSNCMVGAGAVVTRNIVEIGTYVGVPAKKIR
jgi:sugar O-acyltransferase (sialic acid O-acetyltransferase NeuD family)